MTRQKFSKQPCLRNYKAYTYHQDISLDFHVFHYILGKLQSQLIFPQEISPQLYFRKDSNFGAPLRINSKYISFFTVQYNNNFVWFYSIVKSFTYTPFPTQTLPNQAFGPSIPESLSKKRTCRFFGLIVQEHILLCKYNQIA